MGQEQGAIRQDIEHTRERMGETVEALAYKTDVRSRARDSVTGRFERMKQKITGPVQEATPSGEEIKDTARQAVGMAQENPLGLAVGSIAIGFLAGILLPVTRMENERMGPVADELKERSREAAQTALEHGKDAAQDVVEAVGEAAQKHGQEAKSDLQDQAERARQEVGSNS
jgi:hypothetical protein